MRHSSRITIMLAIAFYQCALADDAADVLRFPPDAVVNITLPPYGAVPDDGLDDSQAIQKAITDHVGTGHFLYFPAGVYDISKPLEARGSDGKWNARLVLVGESRERTVLKLADSLPAFADPQKPRAVIATGSVQQEGDSPDGGGNKAFGNSILNMTIDTGRRNRGAQGIAWAVSNFGAIEGVTIRSADGNGVAGIDITRRIPGPGLIRDVDITGFDVGIDVADVQYGITMTRLAVQNQHTAGIRNRMNAVHIAVLRSQNECPAIISSDRQSMVTLLLAELSGGEQSGTAIRAEGQMMVRSVITRGYGLALGCPRRRIVESPKIVQCVEPETPGDGSDLSGRSTALLPVATAPTHHEIDLEQWAAVGERREGESDDTAAIQHAIDSGKPVVYFPIGRTYFISDTIVVRGAVRQIIGMGEEISLGAAREPFSDVDHPRPLFRIDKTDGESLHLEHLFFNAQYPGEVIFENNSPRTVVIRHCGGWVGANGHRRSYRNTSQATGRLFVEDVYLPGWQFTKQDVWARQFNPENFDRDGREPQVLNDGGRLWILGFKTEGPAPFIVTRNGGVTELLGAYNYISATAAPRVPEQVVPYVVDHATGAFTFVTDNFRDNDYPVYIRHITEAGTEDLTRVQMSPRNGQKGDRSFAVPLHRVGAVEKTPNGGKTP